MTRPWPLNVGRDGCEGVGDSAVYEGRKAFDWERVGGSGREQATLERAHRRRRATRTDGLRKRDEVEPVARTTEVAALSCARHSSESETQMRVRSGRDRHQCEAHSSSSKVINLIDPLPSSMSLPSCLNAAPSKCASTASLPAYSSNTRNVIAGDREPEHRGCRRTLIEILTASDQR